MRRSAQARAICSNTATARSSVGRQRNASGVWMTWLATDEGNAASLHYSTVVQSSSALTRLLDHCTILRQ